MTEEASMQQGDTEQQQNQESTSTTGTDEQKPENLFDSKDESKETEEGKDAGNLFNEKDGDEGGEEEEGKEDEEKPGAPEEYAQPEMPEGVEYDAEIGGEFSGIAKELNLTQEAHDKIVALGAKIVAKQQGEFIKAWNDTVAGWQKEIKTDKELGGPNLKQTLGGIRSAVEQFAATAEDAKEILDNPVVSNRPAFIRLMNNVRKSVSEGSAIEGQSGDRVDTPLYDRLWPDKK